MNGTILTPDGRRNPVRAKYLAPLVVLLVCFFGGIAYAAAITCVSGTVCSGTSGADQITGSTDNDVIRANDGKDRVNATQGGTDDIAGGKGDDKIDAQDGQGGDIINCDIGTADVAYADREDTITGCETVNYPPPNGPLPTECQASGAILVKPTDNLATVVNSTAAGTTFCINDGEYRFTQEIDVEAGDKFIGVYADGTRPEVIKTSSAYGNVFDTAGANGAYFRELDISGAVHDDVCEVTGPHCGRGIGGGGSNVTIEKSRLHHNENQGIGGMGNGLTVRDVELDNNGSHDAARDHADGDPETKVTAAGIKTTGTVTLERINAHDNYWTGIWVDVSGSNFSIRDSVATNNGKAGIHYEISDGPFVIENNRVQNNGFRVQSGAYDGRSGGIMSVGSYNGTIQNNTLGGNYDRGIYAIPDSRNSNGSDLNIDILNNTMKGDTIHSCGVNGVVCSGNS